MSTDGSILKAFVENGNLRPVRIYNNMHISKQAFYKLYHSDKFEDGTIEKIEKAVGKKWDEIKEKYVDVNIPRETKGQPVRMEPETITGQSLNNLTESNKVLAEANKTLAEANKTLAEANHVISKNHDELIQLTKMIVANSQALPKSPAGAFGPEGNVVSPGFAAVTPSGIQTTTGRSKGKH